MSRSNRVSLWVALGTLTAAVALFLLRGTQTELRPADGIRHSATLAEGDRTAALLDAPDSDGGSAGPAEPDRRNVEAGQVRLIVLSSDGRPAHGATVTLTSLIAAREWRRQPMLERASNLPHEFTGRTSKTGVTFLPPHSDLSKEGLFFLWATHPDHAANWASYSPQSADSPRQLTLTLGPPRALQASLSKGDRNPSMVVWVVQTLSSLSSASGSSPPLTEHAATEDSAREALVRVLKVDDPSSFQLPQFEYESNLQAVSHHALSAVRVVVPDRRRIQIEMLSTFFLSGSVECEDASSGESGHLAIMTSVGQFHDVLAEYRVAVGSSFGPLEVPLPTTAKLHATVSTSCGGMAAQALDNVAPGEHRFIEFLGQSTPTSWFRIEDPSGDPIQSARVSAAWPSGDFWVQRHGISDPNGYCSVSGVGEDHVQVSVLHARYAGRQGIDCPAFQEQEDAPTITLQPGRNIGGSVHYEGAPVQRFTVISWDQDPRSSQAFSYTDRERGQFELPMQSVSELHLIAAGQSMSSSAVLTVPPGTADITGLVLNCSAAGELQVQVRDSATGQPVEGVAIRHSPSIGRIGLGTIAPDQTTDVQGFAHFESFSTSETLLTAMHPDYSERLIPLPASTPGAARDTLRFAIDRMKQLRVALRPWPPTAWETAWVRIGGSVDTDYEEVDANGMREYDSVPVGPLDVYAVFPDSTTFSWEGYMFAGADKTVVIDLETDNMLDVLLADHRETSDLRIICEYVAIRDDEPAFSLRTLVGDDGRASLRGLPDGYGLVRLSLDDGTEIAEKVVTPEILASKQLTLVRSTHSIAISVVDSEGNPVSGVYAYAAADRAPFALYDWAVSNANGEATIARSGETPSRVFAVDQTRISNVQEYDPNLSGPDSLSLKLIDPVDLVFSAPGAGDDSVEVQCNLFNADPRLWVAEISTSLPVAASPGTYSLVLKTPGLWLDEELIEIPPSGGIVEIKVRRLGVLSVLGASGARLEEIELTDALSRESSTARLARGTISRITTETGAFEFRGLPCGEYHWSARFVDGLVRSGSVQVLPETRSTLEIPRE